MHLMHMLRLLLKTLSVIILIATAIAAYYFGYTAKEENHLPADAKNTRDKIRIEKMQEHVTEALLYCKRKDMDTRHCFLVDMSMPSGANRFFEYDLQKDSVISQGLVAHGSCNKNFLETASFSNVPGSGCTSPGKYKVGGKYIGRFGTAYKLYGLDSSNSNAYRRNIVLHSYYLVPDKETDPLPICNSLGCAMLSDNYLKQLSQTIDAAKKPVLLWIYY